MNPITDSEIDIRPAIEQDWEQFYPFLLAIDQPLDSQEAAFRRYKSKIASPLHYILVAETNTKIVGIAMAHEWDEYLMSGRKQIRFSTLYVLESFRRQGIGKALFLHIYDWAKSIGATWLEWYASPNAVDFYKSLGYEGTLNSNPYHPYYEIEFKRSSLH
ncbi:MAG: N-acetyltransferase family protein [Xenococcaceae cyanobacterium]